jgi:Tfp pilus assembly protein PilV
VSAQGRPQAATRKAARRQDGQAGFTLIEALIAMIVLVFGLIAIANLFVVAGSSNRIAGDSTAAANVAQQQLELLRSTSYETLQLQAGAGPQTTTQNVPGVGDVNVTWTVVQAGGDPQLLFITLRAETTNPVARARSRAEYTVFRACTDVGRGCPVAP